MTQQWSADSTAKSTQFPIASCPLLQPHICAEIEIPVIHAAIIVAMVKVGH